MHSLHKRSREPKQKDRERETSHQHRTFIKNVLVLRENCWSCMSPEVERLDGGLKPTQCIFLFIWLFSFHGFLREAVQTGPLCPCIYAELLCFTRHVRIQTSGIQYFTAGVKFQLLQLCLSRVWTGDITDRQRACSLTERRVCMCFKSIQHTDTEVTWVVVAQWFRPQLHRKTIIKL